MRKLSSSLFKATFLKLDLNPINPTDGRKSAMQCAEVGFGYETVVFKTNFESWPSTSAPPAENRGKVTGNNNPLSFIVCIFYYNNCMIINL
uniref:Uncharacterized protein n=1 Tax=Lactuca sativa TaxID=4236 RepID=A0A9R1XKR9_LACSA|nr:hypothetical protein LSAT_V11C300142400 [Lactuca sativa]